MKKLWKLLKMAAGIGVVLVLSDIVRAQTTEDYLWVMSEVKKPVGQQNSALIDQKLASIVANWQKTSPYYYMIARSVQLERRIQAMPDRTTPEKRQLITQECLDLIAEFRRLYLGPECKDVNLRNQAYGMMIGVANRIPDLTAAYKAEGDITDAMIRDLTEFVVNDPARTGEEKQAGLLSVLHLLNYLHNTKLKSSVTMTLYGKILELETPGSREAYILRGQMKIADGQIEEGLKDFAAALDDPKSLDDVKNLARCTRMRVLSGLQRWADAAPDAEALLQTSISKTTGRVFGPAMAAQSKLDALRVRQALGQLTREAQAAEMNKVLMEVLSLERMTPEEKASCITDVLMTLAKDTTGLGQWDKALGLARAAYSVAPNSQVPATVTLIQQLLADKSRQSLSGTGFNVARNPEDLARAQAFYTRQSGVKPVGGKTVTLKADLSNDGDFPRQLEAAPMPFDGDVRAALERVATGHPDPLSRALAQGLLNQPDAAIDTMAKAVASVGLESPKVSDYVNFTARFVRGKLESVALANAFLKSQIYGPAGPDGKLGTEDDTPNPLMPKAGESVPK